MEKVIIGDVKVNIVKETYVDGSNHLFQFEYEGKLSSVYNDNHEFGGRKRVLKIVKKIAPIVKKYPEWFFDQNSVDYITSGNKEKHSKCMGAFYTKKYRKWLTSLDKKRK